MISLLAPGKRENNFLSTIALGFSFPSLQTHNSIIIYCACALEMVWAAYKTGFQWITASEDHPSLSLSPPLGPSHCPPKLNCHLCFIENSIFKCVIKKAVGQSYRKYIQNTETFFHIAIPTFYRNLYLGKYGCLRVLLDSTLIILREEESNQFKLDFSLFFSFNTNKPLYSISQPLSSQYQITQLLFQSLSVAKRWRWWQTRPIFFNTEL